MSAKNDVMYRNHAVSKTAKDAMIDAEDRVIMQFSRLVRTEKGAKYIRANVNIGMIQFKEIIKTYGLELSNRWEIWDAEKKKNVVFQEN